jgi:hypothetical protein
VAVSAWSAASWTLGAAGHPLAGLAVAAATTAALVPRLRGIDHPVTEAARLAGGGHWHAGRQLAGALTRAWWPAVLAAAAVSPAARRALVGAAVAPALQEWWKLGRPTGAATWVGLRLADDLAYGAGLWAGALRHRTLDPLVPDLTSWPRPGRAERRRRAQAPASAGGPPPAVPTVLTVASVW